MDLERLLTEEARQAVAAAAGRAEQRTAGEIVPYVVGACDDYDDACWKAAAFGAMGGSVAAAAVLAGIELWPASLPLWIAVPAAFGAAMGYLAATVSARFRRALVSASVIELRVRRRALAAFVEEEVFATRDRTGILLFVALFERRAVVLGDAGINRAVRPEEWQGIVDDLVRSIREGRLGDGLVAAVEACGRLLEAHEVEIRPDDVNELSDELRVRDR